MGLGKTVIAGTVAHDLLMTGDVKRVLVIGTLRVVKDTWPADFAKWKHLRSMSFAVAVGSPAKRSAVINGDADIVFINRENVTWLVDEYGKDWPFDMVIIDESSGFKSHSSKRFKSLRKVRHQITRMLQLTGTPVSNRGLVDLWAQMYLLDKGERLERSVTRYKDKYFDSDYMGYTFTPKPGADKLIYDKIRDIVLTMRASDYLEVPQRIDNIIELTLPSHATKVYEQLEKDFWAELDGGEINAANAAVKVGKLLQLTNGAMYVNDGFSEIHRAKLDALDSVIDESGGEPVLVFYQFKSDLVRLREKYPRGVEIRDADDTVKRWNAGEVDLMFAHPASAGHGLNLQEGGRIMVWFGLPWSLELYQQANARLHRQGQTRPVLAHHLVVKESVDIDVLEGLRSNGSDQAALLNSLKRRV